MQKEKTGKWEQEIMCGCYYVDEDTLTELQGIIKGLEDRLNGKSYAGEKYPASFAPVIAPRPHGLILTAEKWGYPGMRKNAVIFNARAETVREKRMFRNGIEHHRVVIPAKRFYEWNSRKEKYSFWRQDSAPLFLAGFEDSFGDEPRFVILTTQANESMVKIHDRMPLILEANQIRGWLNEDAAAEELLHQTPVPLKKWTEYEQQTLF